MVVVRLCVCVCVGVCGCVWVCVGGCVWVCVWVSGVSVLSAGKVLIIGGGIANFTNVAATFKVRVNC